MSHPPPEYAAIRALRLYHHWTYKSLSDMMARAGVRIPHRTLHYLLTKEEKLPRARETTVYNLRSFLEWARQQGYITDEMSKHEPALRSHDHTPRQSKRGRLRKELIPSE